MIHPVPQTLEPLSSAEHARRAAELTCLAYAAKEQADREHILSLARKHTMLAEGDEVAE